MFSIVKYTREEDLINQESHSATSPIEVSEVKDRMVTNKLQLNDEKTEAIICSRRRNPSIKYNNNINNKFRWTSKKCQQQLSPRKVFGRIIIRVGGIKILI